VLLILGVRTTRDLEWPADPDLYRDIAQAQTIADGSLSADPFYRDETVWHNPLVPAIVAALAKPLGVPVHTAYVRLGAYLNLLGPILFFLWVARLAGPAGAAMATLGFVFYRDPWAPAWVTAAYSPWLFAMTSSQAFLYAGLLAYREALLAPTVVRFGITGLLLGLTFLAAAPPAFLLAGVVAVGGLWSVTQREGSSAPATPEGPRGRWTILRGHGLVALVALVVSLPLLASIVGRYGLIVHNTTPTSWEWAGFHDVSEFARVHAGWPLALAAVGAIAIARRFRSQRVDAVMLISITSTAAAFLVYRTLFTGAGLSIPQFVPSHYFVFYMKAVQWALVGVAFSGAFALLRSRLPPSVGGRRVEPTLVAGVAILVILAALPQYRGRGYLESARVFAEGEAGRVNLREAFGWIRANTAPSDVFLASPEVALQVVGPAGRKVVVVGAVFSNPYVDWTERDRSARWMWRALLEGDLATFRSLARTWHVSHLITWRQDQEWLDRLLGETAVPGLTLAFKSGGVRVFRLAP